MSRSNYKWNFALSKTMFPDKCPKAMHPERITAYLFYLLKLKKTNVSYMLF